MDRAGKSQSVADPGFYLRGERGLCQRRGWAGVGGGGRKSLKVLKVEVKIFLACFSHMSIKIMLKINRERRKNGKT